MEKIAALEGNVSRGGARGHSMTTSVGGGPITADSDLSTISGVVGGAGDTEARTVSDSGAANPPSSLSVSATPFEPLIPVTTVSSGHGPPTVGLPSVSSIPSTHIVPSSAATTTPTVEEIRPPPISGAERTSPTLAGTSIGVTDTATTVVGPVGATGGGAVVPPVTEGASHSPAGAVTTDVMATMTLLLQAQAETIITQVKAVAVQSLLSLPHFTGEGSDAVEDGFNK